MASVNFQGNLIKNNIITNLDKALTYINEANDLCSKIKTPVSFDYRNTLNTLDDFLSETKKSVINIKDWLESSNYEYDKAIRNLHTGILLTNTVNIQKRNKIVNKSS